jgi:hypothetical protein
MSWSQTGPPYRASRFEQAYLERIADSGPARGADDVALLAAVRHSVNAGADLPEDLREIDAALTADRGHSLVDLLAVLELLNKLAGDTQHGVSGYLLKDGLDGLDEMIGTNILRLVPHADTGGAMTAGRRLVWTQDALKNSAPQMSEFREAPARLYSRPVLELADRSLFVPRSAPRLALLVLVARILEGNWPERLGAKDGSLTRALEQRRQRVRPVLGSRHPCGLPDRGDVGPFAPAHRQPRPRHRGKGGRGYGRQRHPDHLQAGGAVHHRRQS